MRKLFIAAIVVLFVSIAVPLNTQDILLFKMEDNPFGSLVSLDLQLNQFSLSIWVDKGCGGEYFVGDILTVNWEASHPCQISFWEVEPNGEIRLLNMRPIYADDGTGSTKWTLEGYGYGRRAIFAEAYSQWEEDTAECEYYVLEKAVDTGDRNRPGW